MDNKINKNMVKSTENIAFLYFPINIVGFTKFFSQCNFSSFLVNK